MPTMQNAITKGMILNISSNADVFARGEKYYRDGKILSIKSEEQNNQTLYKVTVEGNYKNYEVTLCFEPSHRLKQYTCNCESHSIWRGACKHVVAALFSLTEGSASVKVPDKGQQAASTLADTLEKLIFEDIDASLTVMQAAPVNPVRLVPCFHYNSHGEAFITVTVGYSRMYVVKSITAFLTSVKREETVSYGNGLRFNHSPAMFDEDGRQLIAFMNREESLLTEMAKRMSRQFQYMQNTRTNTRALILTERNMDDFFDLLAGREIDGDIDGETRLHLRTDKPEIRLRIKNNADHTLLTADPFNYRVMHGLKHHYLISRSAIHRLPKNDALILIHILRALSDSPRSEIVFTGTEQKRFLSVILPKLSKMGFVAAIDGDVPQYQVNEMTAKLYFDSDGRDITGRLAFHYGSTVIDPLDNILYDVLRDAAGEYAVKRQLTLLGFNADAAKKLYVLTGNDAIYSFLNGAIETDGPKAAGIESLKDYAEVYISEALAQKTVRVKMPAVGIRLQGNLLDITLEDSGYTLGELMEALEAYKAHKKFHRLRDGRFLPLDGEDLAPVADMMAALDVSKKEIHGNTLSLPSYRALYVDELTSKGRMNPAVRQDSHFKQLIDDFNSNAELSFETPESLTGVLREYQKKGYQWLKTLAHYSFGGILADDMGLGKTIQVIAVLLSEKKEGGRSLVVAPTSLLYNWENEIKRFAPQLRTVLISGLPEKRRELIQSAEGDVLITTYDMMKRDIACYEGLTFAYVIADEAQNIKNPSTQNAKALKEIQSKVRFALTGTPIENTLTELWSIFDFIMPGYLHSAHKFNRLYEHPILRDNNTACAAKLRQQIEPFVLRRIKKNVLKELPDKTETTLLAELAAEQKKIYKAHLLIAKGELDNLTAKDNFAGNRMQILAQLTRLRQVCCHPALFAENYRGGSGKLDLAMETIELAIESGHRILLFSQFTSMLGILRTALDNTPFAYFYLDGATKAQDRMDMTARFNAGERELFLISLKAGGTGLNLTGADVVIHYDPWWNPSVMDQASDRAHRYGQEKAVQIFNIVAKDTIEEKILALQEKKRDLIDSVITEGGNFINALSEEEVRALFADTAI